LSFDPSNCSLKFWKSIKTPSPKVGVTLGVWELTPSHFPTLLGICDVTLELPLGLHPCNPFALVTSPKLRLWDQMQDENKPMLVFADLWRLNWRTIQNRVEELRRRLTISTIQKKKWLRRTFKVPVVMFRYKSLKLSIVLGGRASELVRYAEVFFSRRETGTINYFLRI
jgi:hypothetical protein